VAALWRPPTGDTHVSEEPLRGPPVSRPRSSRSEGLLFYSFHGLIGYWHDIRWRRGAQLLLHQRQQRQRENGAGEGESRPGVLDGTLLSLAVQRSCHFQRRFTPLNGVILRSTRPWIHERGADAVTMGTSCVARQLVAPTPTLYFTLQKRRGGEALLLCGPAPRLLSDATSARRCGHSRGQQRFHASAAQKAEVATGNHETGTGGRRLIFSTTGQVCMRLMLAGQPAQRKSARQGSVAVVSAPLSEPAVGGSSGGFRGRPPQL
jgi:hypothetical protein